MDKSSHAPPPVAQMDIPFDSPAPNTSSFTEIKHDNVFCGSTPFDAILPCNACFIVPERMQIVELFFGKYHGTITKPGCYCRTNIGMELRRVGTDLITYDMQNTKVLDSTGSPIVISGIVTYEVVDARRAAIDVNDPHRFVRDQAPAILKRVVSQFPYESDDPNVPCLRTETATVGDRMRDALQQRVSTAGVRIETFNINELSYAPEIAQAMLKRQQADALIAARRAIVSGAREIADEAVGHFSDMMSQDQKANLLSNLLIVLVGDKDVTPTLQV